MTAPDPFSTQNVRRRLVRLHSLETQAHALPLRRGDFVLNPDLPVPEARRAAVLIPLVEGDRGLEIILTRRSDALRRHRGEIALPGGKVDPGETAVAAALREAEEEIGLQRGDVEAVGVLDAYHAGSGYLIAPVVGFVSAGAALAPNPAEVAEVFRVPLAALMDPANHETRSRVFAGRERWFYAIPHESRTIWGITAGILRTFYEQVFAEEGP